MILRMILLKLWHTTEYQHQIKYHEQPHSKLLETSLLNSWQRSWVYDHTARYTYNIIHVFHMIVISESHMSGFFCMIPCWKMIAIELAPSQVLTVNAAQRNCWTFPVPLYKISAHQKGHCWIGITKFQNITAKDLLFEFISGTKRSL